MKWNSTSRILDGMEMDSTNGKEILWHDVIIHTISRRSLLLRIIGHMYIENYIESLSKSHIDGIYVHVCMYIHTTLYETS